jgi:hypothetical protein
VPIPAITPESTPATTARRGAVTRIGIPEAA